MTELSLFDADTGEVLVLDAGAARNRADRIRVVAEGLWQLIAEAYSARDWLALGYATWDDYCTREFGTGRIAIPREERAETVASLRSAGLSLRAISSATGLGRGTIERELSGVPNGTPEAEVEPGQWARDDQWPSLVNGLDGKQYQSYRPPAVPSGGAHVGNNSGEVEWYTPPEYIEAARAVMGGIDLDPASCETANEQIKAVRIFTADDDGLSQPWVGRVWMNPPYSGALMGAFCERLAEMFTAGSVTEAIVLTNNATETRWFQDLAAVAASICLHRGRIRFWYPGRPSFTPLQGQTLFYLGGRGDRFAGEFRRFGTIVDVQ